MSGGASKPIPPMRSTSLLVRRCVLLRRSTRVIDRKSTRLNSSHGYISYAVFCLKKKKKFSCVYVSKTPFDDAATDISAPHPTGTHPMLLAYLRAHNVTDSMLTLTSTMSA